MQYFSLQFPPYHAFWKFSRGKTKKTSRYNICTLLSIVSHLIKTAVENYFLFSLSVSFNSCLLKKKKKRINSHSFILSSHKLLLIKLAKTSMNFSSSETVHPSTPILLISFKCQQFLFFCFSWPLLFIFCCLFSPTLSWLCCKSVNLLETTDKERSIVWIWMVSSVFFSFLLHKKQKRRKYQAHWRH